MNSRSPWRCTSSPAKTVNRLQVLFFLDVEMRLINPHSEAGVRIMYRRQYGRGFGSFLKNAFSSAGNALKATTKEVGKLAISKGKEIAKHAGTRLKEAAKDVLQQGIASGKELAANAAAAAAAEGKRILAEHGQNLVDNLASANSFADIGDAVKKTAREAGQDLKSSSQAIVRDSIDDAKQRSRDLAKHAIIATGQAALNTAMDSMGIGGDGGDEEGEQDGGRLSLSAIIAGKKRSKKGAGGGGGVKGGAIYFSKGGGLGNGTISA
jgi:hypothetical protein